MFQWLRSSLPARAGLAVILISSDLPEVIGLSDRIAVMRSGNIEQIGAPAAIYETPVTSFVAAFIVSIRPFSFSK